jgi:hypothetical protein
VIVYLVRNIKDSLLNLLIDLGRSVDEGLIKTFRDPLNTSTKYSEII